MFVMNNIFMLNSSRTYILFTVASLMLWAGSCRQKAPVMHVESGRNLVGLASIIQLNPDGKTVPIADYFIHPGHIDSVSCTSGIVRISDDQQFFIFKGNISRPMDLLKVYSGDTTFSLLVKHSDKIKTSFQLIDAKKEFATVNIRGDINQWNQRSGKMAYVGGLWDISFWLAPGEYQYLLVIDGKEMLDYANPDSVNNNMGGYNSLKVVAQANNQSPVLTTKSYNDDEITIGMENTKSLIVLWQNQQIPVEKTVFANNEAIIEIPKTAKQLERSFIRVVGMNGDKTGNDLFIPLVSGKVLNQAAQLKRTDWQANILYFMIVDRFYNADPSNDGTMNIPEVNPRADYYGGDIKGITEKIKSGYFEELGVNSIWLSPIGQNPLGAYGLYPTPKTKFSAYHGYWPTSWNKIDFRLGNPRELKEMVAVAHKHNLNVLIDFVANHVHEEHPMYKKHPEWATELYLPDGSLNTERWDEYRLTTWFDTFLPTLDLTNPELTDILTDSAVFWINEYDLDGFRHDATKHVPEYFWRELTKKLKKEAIVPKNKVLYQIGETYGSRELIASYVNSGEMNAQFDFGLYDNALACFAQDGVSFERLKSSLNESFAYYGYHHLMGNISGNQDKPRFMAYAGGDLRFDEDSKLAGWTREISVTNPLGYEKLKSFLAFNLTIPGIPVIYYGDEIGMTGANDPDNRRPMRFDLTDNEEIEVKNTVTRLAKLRRSRLELTYGEFTWLYSDDDVLVYSRTYFDKISIIAFNKNDEVKEVSFELPAQYRKTDLFDLTKTKIENTVGLLNLSMQPNSFMIIQNK
jgi:cyclomaltodextrinase / maltogenic alpha-amylase / neopullulanase